MSITLNQTRTDGGEFTSLAEVREAILAAAREAQAADRHDTLDIAIPNGWYGITEPFVLSAKENPELNFVDITLRGEYERLAVIHSLALIPEAGFTPVKGKPYFKYQFAKDENGKYPLFHDLFVGGVRAESAVSATWRNPFHFTKEERAGEAKVKGFYAPIEIAEQLDRGTTLNGSLPFCTSRGQIFATPRRWTARPMRSSRSRRMSLTSSQPLATPRSTWDSARRSSKTPPPSFRSPAPMPTTTSAVLSTWFPTAVTVA